MSFSLLNRAIRISWKNVFRNKRRTFISIAIVAMGASGVILIGGFFDNIMVGLKEQIIHSQTGHLEIAAKDYFSKGVSSPYDYLMSDIQAIQSAVEAKPGVLFTVPRIYISGMAATSKTSFSVMLLGADADRERVMGGVESINSDKMAINIEEGVNLDSTDPYGAILGKGLMKALDLKIGDTLTVITNQKGGAIDSAQFVIRGSFVTVMKDIDDRLMKVNLHAAQKLAGTPNRLNSLLVILDDTDKTEALRTILQRDFRDRRWSLDLRSWNEAQPYYEQSRKMLSKIHFAIMMIVCLVLLFSIANSIGMSLLERVREFGNMMALGNSRGFVFGMILAEGLILGFIASSMGLLCGSLLATIVSSIGITMPPPPQGTSSYHAVISLSPHLLSVTFVLCFLSTVLSTIAPAVRVVRMEIVHALGYV